MSKVTSLKWVVVNTNNTSSMNSLILFSTVSELSFSTTLLRLKILFLILVKIKYSDYILYSDTDSFFMSCELPSQLVGNELGQFKLEYKIKECVFIAPKVYGLTLEDGTSIVKIKGSKNRDITLDQLKSLLVKDSFIKFKQDK
jgi:hypothetical protein